MLEKGLFHSLNQFSRHFSKTLNEVLVPLGLYSGQWLIIFCLKKNGSVTQSELAQYIGVELPSITRALLRLEKAGLILRETGKDKREKIISLTEKAIVEYPKWHAAIQAFEQKMLSNISVEEIETMLQAIKKMKTHL